MIKYKYRIKTEKEFLDEFGYNWRMVVRYHFIKDMDHLLGQDIEETYYIKFLNENNRLDFTKHLYFSFKNFGWFRFSPDMIKEINVGINYNEPKKLVYD